MRSNYQRNVNDMKHSNKTQEDYDFVMRRLVSTGFTEDQAALLIDTFLTFNEK